MPNLDSIHIIKKALHDLCVDGAQGAIELIDDKKLPEALGQLETTQCAGYAPQRQAEFIMGRRCARSALEALGYNHANNAIETSKEGLPVWPKGFLASISHSKGLCGAVAASSKEYQLLGFDIEKTNRLSNSASKRVIHPIEAEQEPTQRIASILFSLKEAFYKAQYPIFGVSANFDDLALQLDHKIGSASILYMAPKFSPKLIEAQANLNFRFVQINNEVLSLCSLRT